MGLTLIDGPPKVLSPAIDRDEDFVQKPRITESTLSSLQALGVVRTELCAPLPNGFVRHGDSSFGKQIFDISEAHAESMVEPDGMTNDLGRESMSAVAVFHLISLPPAVLT